MTRPRQPLFLERQSYRRRRLIDASRVIPVFGLCLFLVPMLWSGGGAEAPGLAARGIYIFAVWFALVLATAAVSHRLMRRMQDGAQTDAGSDSRPDPRGRAPEPGAATDGASDGAQAGSGQEAPDDVL